MGKLDNQKQQQIKKQQKRKKLKKKLSLKKKCHACYYNLPDQYSHMHCTNGCLN